MTHNPPPVISDDKAPTASHPPNTTPVESSQSTFSDAPSKENSDYVYNYNCALLTDGLFFLNFLDAVSEGDGLRLMRQCKYMLLYCRADGHHSNNRHSVSTPFCLQETVKGLFATELSTTGQAEVTTFHMIWRWSTATCSINRE